MDKIETLIAYCKKNGGTIMFPKPLHLTLPYDDESGEPDLLGLKLQGDELYIVDMWRNYDRPKTRLLCYLYHGYVEAVCDHSIRWLEGNFQEPDKNLF